MTKDIRATIRQLAGNDSARAIIATAAGELIKKVGAPRQRAEQSDSRVLASGLGGFAAGAGAVTVASATAKGIGKLIGRRRRPLFADVPKKAAAGTRKAVEVPREAVDRFASGLRDQIGGRGHRSSAKRPSSSDKRPSSSDKRPTTSAKRPSRSAKRASTSARRPATAGGSRRSGASATRTRSSNGSGGGSTAKRSTAKSSRSSNGSGGGSTAKRSTAKSSRSSNGGGGGTRAPARAKASGRR